MATKPAKSSKPPAKRVPMKRAEDTTAQRVITPVGIACFPSLWAPSRHTDKYGLVLLFKRNEDITNIKRAVIAAAEVQYGAKARPMLKSRSLHVPWRDADEYEEQYGEPFKAGLVFISPKSTRAPQVVDADGNPIDDQEEIYGGCKVRVSVFATCYDNSGNKGVTLLLNNVQKVADGKRYDGRVSAEEEFGAYKGAERKSRNNEDEDENGDEDEI